MMSISKANEKPIILLGGGPSVAEIEPHKDRIAGATLGAVNRFDLIEHLLPRPVDFVYCSSSERLDQIRWKIPPRKIITTYEGALFTTHLVSNVFSFGYGYSSLFACLCALGKMGATRIYLVGFDGGAEPGQSVYHKTPDGENEEARRRSIEYDTIMMNWHFHEYWKYIGLPPAQIVNQTGSRIKIFPKLSTKGIVDEVCKHLDPQPGPSGPA